MRRFSTVWACALTAVLAACGGGGGGGDDGGPGPVDNVAPVADAGVAQNVLVGATVRLDGSASNDPDRAPTSTTPLVYRWTLQPATGSAVELSADDVARPTFVADTAGTYTATLVVNDGKTDSTPTQVKITATAGDVAPVADAGPAQVVFVGATVTLDGRGSRDANGDSIGYLWEFAKNTEGKVQIPAGSKAALSSSSSSRPTFVADVAGDYSVRLHVSDGTHVSAPALVVVRAIDKGNVPPIAAAGADQTVVVGSTVTVNGGGSRDPNGSIAVWNWKLVSQPAGSNETLTDAGKPIASFVASAVGDYVLELSVGDTLRSITFDTVVVTAVPADPQLLRVDAGISGEPVRTQLALPYTAASTLRVQEGCTGCPTRHVVASYELKATGAGHVVSDLFVRNLDGGPLPTIEGLAAGTVVAGQTVAFKLIAPLGGQTARNYRWGFKVDGEAFDYSVQLNPTTAP